MKTARRFKDLPKTYANLVAILPPRPIHTEEEYDEAAEIVSTMAGHDLNRDQEDYLMALARFIEDYDQEHDPIPVSSPVDVLKHLMEHAGMTVTQLGMLLGDRSLGSRVLSGERGLSKRHIKALCDRFKVSPALFLR